MNANVAQLRECHICKKIIKIKHRFYSSWEYSLYSYSKLFRSISFLVLITIHFLGYESRLCIHPSYLATVLTKLYCSLSASCLHTLLCNHGE